MAAINVDKMSLKELVALEGKIQGAIVEARAKERVDLKSKVAALALSHGVSIADWHQRPQWKVQGVGCSELRNPDDASDTWTGRGRKPNWLLARLKKGAQLSEFEI